MQGNKLTIEADTRAYQKIALDTHNQLRNQHKNTATLELDAALCKSAIEHAEAFAQRNMMKLLSGKTDIGENIISCRTSNQTAEDIVTKAIDKWYAQGQNYAYETGKTKNATAIGNFTQMMWTNSHKFGVGIAKSGDQTFVVAHYFPAGNVLGSYTTNVHEKIAKQLPLCSTPVSELVQLQQRIIKDSRICV